MSIPDKKAPSNRWKIGAALLAAAVLFVWAPSRLSSYLLHIAILILFFSYLGSAWNIVGGYAGQFSFGHCAFVGVGAYASSLLYVKAGVSPWIGMAAGALLGAVLGGFIGFLTFRYKLKGAFFALATFAFSEMLRIIALNWEMTGKAMGILIPLKQADSFRNFQFVDKLPYYYIILSMVLLVMAISYGLDRTRLGYYLKALREDEEAAGSLGINVVRYKITAMLISSSLTAAGGVFYAQYMFYIDPDIAFSPDMTMEMVLRTMLGGVGTVFGPLLGSAVLESVSEVMRTLTGGYKGLHIMFYGAILIFVMIFFPHGLMGLIRKKR
jgi:branched-chain amino acid transport system permease protein